MADERAAERGAVETCVDGWFKVWELCVGLGMPRDYEADSMKAGDALCLWIRRRELSREGLSSALAAAEGRAEQARAKAIEDCKQAIINERVAAEETCEESDAVYNRALYDALAAVAALSQEAKGGAGDELS